MQNKALWASLLTVGLAIGCSGSDNSTGPTNAGGAGNTGGITATGGIGAGGVKTNGGASSAGGTAAIGGTKTNGGSPSTGGTLATGGINSAGGITAAGGTSAATGGTKATGGTPSAGGTTSAGGSKATGGTPASTGGTPATGGAATGGSTGNGTCDAGSSTTTWASNCPTAAPTTCTAGTWVAAGPEPDPCCSAMTKCSESTHFAVYSDEACTTGAQDAVTHLETVWSLYFTTPMWEREPLCNSATKNKVSVHVHSTWGLTGGAWDSTHMGMWIGTGGLEDHWGLAHEFRHGVQAVEGGMACNQANTCGWVYESHANWSAQQQVEYHTSNVHCSEYLANVSHLYLGSTRMRYCNWQFMEFLKDKYCYSAVNAIWDGSPAVDNPFTGIMNGQKWSVSQLNDYIGEYAMHNITWDYQDPPPESTAGGNQGALFRSNYGLITDTSQTWRRLRTTKVEPLDTSYASNRRFISPYYWAPQPFGYNVIRLYPDSGATSVTVTFRGITTGTGSPDWRWGLVATDTGITKARYSTRQSGSDGQLTFCVNSGEYLWLVIAATPSTLQKIIWDQAYNTVPRYPYMIQLGSAWPEGFQNGTQDACPSGLTRATNGGGCAPSGTTAYVGPYATVLSGTTVGSGAHIQDHAIVASGTVSGGTVGAMSLIGSTGGQYNVNTFSISSGTAMTTFFPLGWFASGQSIAGGTLDGDVEFQGQGVTIASGQTCSGYVDGSTCTGPGTDATPAPPYTWRP